MVSFPTCSSPDPAEAFGDPNLPNRRTLHRAALVGANHTGHITPLLALTRLLSRAGVEVHFFVPTSHHAVVLRHGAAFAHAYNRDPNWNIREAVLRQITAINAEVDKLAAGEFFPAIILPATVDVFDTFLDQLREIKPDVIIFDSSYAWGALAAQALSLPAVSSCSSAIMSSEMLDASFGFIRGLPHIPDCTAWLVRRVPAAQGTNAVDAARAYGNYTDFTIVWTIPEFLPPDAPRPSYARFYGPSFLPDEDVSRPAVDVSSDNDLGKSSDAALMNLLATTRRARARVQARCGTCDGTAEPNTLVYCSMGTVLGVEGWTGALEPFFHAMFSAFADLPNTTVLLSCGASASVLASRAPANFMLRTFIPQRAVLRSADVFITHGGMNSVQEALVAACPMVVVPSFGDQEGNAARVEALGVGVTVRAPFKEGQPVRDVARTGPQHLRRAFDSIQERYLTVKAVCDGIAEKIVERNQYMVNHAVREIQEYVSQWEHGNGVACNCVEDEIYVAAG